MASKYSVDYSRFEGLDTSSEDEIILERVSSATPQGEGQRDDEERVYMSDVDGERRLVFFQPYFYMMEDMVYDGFVCQRGDTAMKCSLIAKWWRAQSERLQLVDDPHRRRVLLMFCGNMAHILNDR